MIAQRFHVAIVGFGAAGLMVLRELIEVSAHPAGFSIAMFDASTFAARGTAYSTVHQEHLLNVRALNMGIAADNPQGFSEWLAYRAEPDGLNPHAFLPRALYGDYLKAQWQQIRAHAAQKRITLVHLAETVELITPQAQGYRINTQVRTYDAAQVVLTTGNLFTSSPRAQATRQSSNQPIQYPWQYDFAALKKLSPAEITIIGTGLSAVDTIVSLLAHGFAGRIVCCSRHGWFPAVHSAPCAPIAPSQDLLNRLNTEEKSDIAPLRLSDILHAIRHTVRTHPNQPWQAVMDGLRPYTIALWQALSLTDKQRFLTRHFTLWNIHRHRMAPQIHSQIIEAIARGQLIIHRGRYTQAITNSGLVFDCRGPDYRTVPTALSALLEAGIVNRHESGAGLALVEDLSGRVTAAADFAIYALGALTLGARLEATAVPELRVQARDTVAALMKSFLV